MLHIFKNTRNIGVMNHMESYLVDIEIKLRYFYENLQINIIYLLILKWSTCRVDISKTCYSVFISEMIIGIIIKQYYIG